MTRTCLVAAIVAASLPLASASASAAPQLYTYQTFGSALLAINDTGTIVGGILSPFECFIQQAGRAHTRTQQVFPPNVVYAICGQAINNAGIIVGNYSITPNVTVGYILSGGTYTTFAPFGSTNTYVADISNNGVIAGGYLDASGVSHGFLYDGTTFTTHDAPGATSSTILGVNASGAYVIRGTVNGVTMPYLISATGEATLLAFPHATHTGALKLTDNGMIALTYYYRVGHNHAGVYNSMTKTYTQVRNPAGAVYVSAKGVNNRGQVVGTYFDASNAQFGFLATPRK